MNELIIVLCYVLFLSILVVSKKTSVVYNSRDVEAGGFYVPENTDEGSVIERRGDDIIRYMENADRIIELYTYSDVPDKREQIVNLLRDMVDIMDTGEFLDKHEDIREYIFRSSA